MMSIPLARIGPMAAQADMSEKEKEIPKGYN
jgi:hypothetical protein